MLVHLSCYLDQMIGILQDFFFFFYLASIFAVRLQLISLSSSTKGRTGRVFPAKLRVYRDLL